MCPLGSPDCYQHDPLRDACSGASCAADEVCCYQEGPAGVSECRDLRNDDLNCGGCDNACEWDEVCLDGVCARGAGASCFETECPPGTWCVSDDPVYRTDPKCKALWVDNDNCGAYGHQCPPNRRCMRGVCKLKRRIPCDGTCGEGESCCWMQGTEFCVDSQNDPNFCGSCDTICASGMVCDQGTCQPWFDVFDPCPPGFMDCKDGPDVVCKDVMHHPKNCGGCGLACSDHSSCVNGACRGPAFGTNHPEEP
jgi:hypothetical protein